MKGRARETLVILTEPGEGLPTVPTDYVAQALGLAFASLHRGGAMVSGAGGHGFVIRKARSLLNPFVLRTLRMDQLDAGVAVSEVK